MDESGAESTEELHFFYDAQSRPAFVEYNGVKYRYVHNLQGDIVGIVDSAGNLVVEYKYDAWGKPLSITGTLKTSLGELNPFRYRGYVLDEGTGLYYLRSRYYDATIMRFINEDSLIICEADAVGGNIFSYSWNNPTKYKDSDGCSPIDGYPPAKDVYYLDGVTAENANIMLAIHYPKLGKEDIENFIIGHFEVAVKVKENWYTFSYGPESTGDVKKKGWSHAMITVRVNNRKWNDDYSSFFYANRISDEKVGHVVAASAFFMGVSIDTAMQNGKRRVVTKGMDIYSLDSNTGNVCRSFCSVLLDFAGWNPLSYYNDKQTYYPWGFYKKIQSLIKAKK